MIDGKKTISSEEILSTLSGFTGSEHFYHHWLGPAFTEGVKYMAEVCQAFWLVDAIASYQRETVLCSPDARAFQVWMLIVKPDHSATLECRLDSGRAPLIVQEFDWTTFPLSSMEIWVEGNTMLLPSEH